GDHGPDRRAQRGRGDHCCHHPRARDRSPLSASDLALGRARCLRLSTRGGSMKRAFVLTGLTVAVALAASGAGARAASSACPTSNPPNELLLVGGSGQQAQLGKQFAENLRVALANTNGCPLTG